MIEEFDEKEVVASLENPTPWLKEYFQESLKGKFFNTPVSGVSTPTSGIKDIKIFAQIEKYDGNKDVISVAVLKPNDLYAYADAPILDFCSYIHELKNDIDAALLSKKYINDIEWEIFATDLLLKFKRFAKFIGISALHDELIYLFVSFSISRKSQILTKEETVLLQSCFEICVDKLQFTDSMLEEVILKLERMGFDLNCFMDTTQSE